jgi:hypothetical protein
LRRSRKPKGNGIAEQFRRLHYDTANATSAPTMAALMKLVPTSQITFGSDYPYFPSIRSR